MKHPLDAPTLTRLAALDAVKAELLSLKAELDEWRGYASFLAVHGITPPTPSDAPKEPQ